MDWSVSRPQLLTLILVFDTDNDTVIVLIAAEILVAAVNIVVDLYAGVD